MPEDGSDDHRARAHGSDFAALNEFHDDVEERFLPDLKARRRRAVVPTPMRNSDILPLDKIEPEVFERVIAEVVAAQDNHSVHFYGRRGQAQYGLDVVEEKSAGERVLYQVKRFAKMTPAGLREAVVTYAGPPRAGPDQMDSRPFNPGAFIVVTSAPVEDDTALVDCIGDLQDEYRGDLQIDAWGAETVSRRLRDHRGLVNAVLSSSWADEWCGPARRRRVEKREKRKRYVDEVLNAAMNVQFSRDNDIRFRQVELSGVTVESLFVDVPASSHPGSPADRLIREMNPHQQERRTGGVRTRSSPQAGAAQALLHPSWTESTVIVGGPGQGKTTLLQFLCQYHRARSLNRAEYSPIAAGLAPVTRVSRTPIKVELTEFAAWRRERLQRNAPSAAEGEVPDVGLLGYVAHVVAVDAGRPFSHEDLALAIASRPMLLALDGLDEIADTIERTIIADEVRMMNSRIQAITRGVMLLVATRPGSIGNPIWRDINFAALFLSELTPALRMKYLDRWTAQSKLAPPEIADLRATFVKSIALAHVVELAGNPMQLAILLNLMQRRAVLPEKRTALYDRYIEVFMDRESKSSIVAANKDVIVSFHKLLGWHIHAQVELGRSNGAVSLGELRRLLTDYLTPRGYPTDFVNELFDSVTTRVLCLVQRELDSHEFQFEVQPLREYFAAEHIYDVSPNNTSGNNRQACLAALIRRPYWSNVMRFFAGKFSSGEVPTIPYTLRALQRDKAIQHHPITRTAAKYLLDDRVLGGQLELVVTDMVKVILDGPGSVLAMDGLLQQDESVIRFQERGGLKQASEVLIDMLSASSDNVAEMNATAELLRHLNAHRTAADAWWPRDDVAPDIWLQVAARLGAFDKPDPKHIRRLPELTAGVDAGNRLLRNLVEARAAIVDDALVSVCLTELRTGRDDVNQPDRTTPYGRLAAAASVQRFYDHRNAASDPSPGSVKRRHRGRVRSASGLWNTAVHTLERAHSAGVWDKAKSWHDVLDVTYSFWDSDCWAVREAILAVPDFALRTEASTPRLDQGAGWRDIAAWRAQALERRSDVDWLIAEGRKCSHHLARMSFGLYALTAVGSSVMAKIINDIEDAIRPLECSEWGAVSAAAHRYASNSIAPSEINISEALRLQKVQPSGRTAVLLWRLSNESTRKRLARHIAPDLKTLWGCGFGVVDVLREFLEVWDKKVPVDSFLGSRPDIPAGTLEPARIAQMTYAQAQNILERPADWPTDIVRVAVDRLGTRLSNQIPVLEVARTDEWRT